MQIQKFFHDITQMSKSLSAGIKVWVAETNGFLTLNEFSPCQGMTQYKEIGSFLTLLCVCLSTCD